MSKTPPTKKQQAMLQFIDGFIKGNGYGPSYREVMRALDYKSVSTVAAHIDALIAKGYLRKGDGYSARSIEVVTGDKELSGKDAALGWLSSREAAFRKDEDVESADKIAVVIEILKHKQN